MPLPVMSDATLWRRSPPSGRPDDGVTVQGRGERDHRGGAERLADVAADGRGVPDLERGQQRVRRDGEDGCRGPVDAEPRPCRVLRRRRRASRSCRSRRSAGPRPRPRGRASPSWRGRRDPVTSRWGSENSQVPPPSTFSPGASVRSARERREAVRRDRVQIHCAASVPPTSPGSPQSRPASSRDAAATSSARIGSSAVTSRDSSTIARPPT